MLKSLPESEIVAYGQEWQGVIVSDRFVVITHQASLVPALWYFSPLEAGYKTKDK